MTTAIYALASFGAVALIATCAVAVALWRVIINTNTEDTK